MPSERSFLRQRLALVERQLANPDQMYRYARKLGKFSGPDPLEGVEVNIRLASILRSVRRTP